MSDLGLGRTAVALLVAGTLLLTACTASGDAAAPTALPSSDTSRLAGLTDDQLLAEVDATTTAVERELADMSGMTAELGGRERTDAALAALAAKAADQAARLHAKGGGGRFAAVPAGTENQFGAMTGAALVSLGLVAQTVNASDRMSPDGPESQTSIQTDGESRLETTQSRGRVTTTTSVTTSADGLTGTMKVSLDAAPCPDASGKFTLKGTIETSSQVTGGRAGMKLKIEFEISGRVDDDARIVAGDTDTSVTIQASSSDGSSEQFVDVTFRDPHDGQSSVTFNRFDPNASATFRQSMTGMGVVAREIAKKFGLEAIQQSIESGRCVDLQIVTSPGKRTNLPPSTEVSITAQPRSRIDGAPTGGTVKATLSGDTSLDPQGTKVAADANFTYVAPGEPKKSASVSFEARSRRGVGRAEANFTTAPGAYTVTGSFPTNPKASTFSGTVCALDKPFTVTVGGGLPGTMRFTPSSEEAGSWTYAGRPFNAPFSVDGKGPYTATPGTGTTPGRLKFSWRLTIRIPRVGSRTSTGPVSLTLTPRASCDD